MRLLTRFAPLLLALAGCALPAVPTPSPAAPHAATADEVVLIVPGMH